MDDETLKLLPPALRMAAASKPRTTPGKSQSFQKRKEHNDALAKVRCQPRMDMISEDQKRRSILQKRKEEKSKRDSEAKQREADLQSEVIMQTMTKEQDTETLGMSWSRSNFSPGKSPGSRKASLTIKAKAMREKIAKLELEVEQEAAAPPKKEGKSVEVLEKKLDKVEKLLAKEEPGTKDHKKLTKKKDQYERELEDLLMEEMQSPPAIDELKKAQTHAAMLEEALEEAELELKEAKEAQERRRQEEEAAAAAAQAEAESKRKEAEEEKRRQAAKAAKTIHKNEEMDEKERIRQERIEEYHRKQAEKKAQEEEAKRQAERNKEFKTLKKKLAKLEGMISDAEKDGKDTAKLFKKKREYISQLEQFDEWNVEVEERRQQEEENRIRKERELEEAKKREEEEKARQEALEAERRRKAEEEEEQRRKEAEEARRELEEAQRLREEEEERIRQEEMEKAKRLEEEVEQRRLEEEAEAKRQEEEEKERLRQQEEEEAEARRLEEERVKEEENARLERERIRLEQEEKVSTEEPEDENIHRTSLIALQPSTFAWYSSRYRSWRLFCFVRTRGKPSSKVAESTRAPPPKEETEEEKAEREERERLTAERQKKEEEEHAKRREELREQTKKAEAEASKDKERKAPERSASQDFLDLRAIPEPHSENTKLLLAEIEAVEEKQAKYEKTLKSNGIAVSEDIPYEVAKDKIAELQEEMKALAISTEDPYIVQKKYATLEEDLTKYITAMMLTDEYAEEQRLAEEKWEESILEDNIAALRKVRSHMPVNIRNMTEDELTNQPTPNGKNLPKAMARKFKRSNVLQLLRVNPVDLERMHPSLIEGLRSTGLTLTERRALHEHLKEIGSRWQELQQDPSIERKFTWFSGLKMKFKEMVTAYDKHVAEYGPPDNHPYAKRNDPGAGGCPLIGNQCPLKADSAMSYDDDYGFTQEAEYEKSEAAKSSLGESGHGTPAKAKATTKKSRPITNTKEKDEELASSIRGRLDLTEPESDIDSKLFRELFFAEKRLLSLEKQLTQNGIALPKEDIPFALAKAKVAEITEDIKIIASKMGTVTEMKEMAVLEKEYSQLSDELEKYNNALMLTKEWALELLEKERQWEDNVRPGNEEALRKIRSHMPVNIKDLSENDMIQGYTPNGKQLPQKIVRKFKRTNILQLLRMPKSSIEPMHPSSLESMRSTGLTLTERRALHEHLKELGARWKAGANDKMAERKWVWHESLRNKFKELVDKYQKHVDDFGPPDNHKCSLLGKQCPLKADLDIDYSEDYGFPPEAVYNVEQVKKSNLLTVEELERRKQDEDWGYDAPVQKPEETPRPPPTGLMASIASSGGGSAHSSDSGPPKPKMGGGLLAAIASKGGGDKQDGSANTTPAAKPRMGGGLLAAIQSKGGPESDASGESAPDKPAAKPRMGGGLLAAIQARGKN